MKGQSVFMGERIDNDAIRNHKNIIKRYKLQGFKVTKD